MITDTSGFYAYFDNELQYAPNSIHFPDGSTLVKGHESTYTYPHNGWTYFESKLLAEEFFGIAVLLNA